MSVALPARHTTILPPAPAANDGPEVELDDRPTVPSPAPVMISLSAADALRALPAALQEFFIATEEDGFVLLEIVTMSTSDARRRKLDRAMSALTEAGLEAWPGEDGASIEVSRPAPPEHITAAVFAEPAPGELVEDLVVLASEAAARGFTLVAAEVRSISREITAGEVNVEGARVSFKTFAEAATAARQPTRAELYDRAAEACERARQMGGA